jgi:hypothetical protein
MAYNVIHALAKHWYDLDLTTQKGLDQLATLCLTELHFPKQTGVPPASHSKRLRPATFLMRLRCACRPKSFPVCVRRNH